MLPIWERDLSNRENFIILAQLDKIIKRHKTLVLVHCNLTVGAVAVSLKVPMEAQVCLYFLGFFFFVSWL